MFAINASLEAKMLKVVKLQENAKLPQKNVGDAGYDLFCTEQVTILPGGRTLVSTGIALEIPSGYVGLVWPRSGMAVNWGLDTLAGVIDSTYRGELKVLLYNTGDDVLMFKEGTKVAQLVVQQHAEFEVLEVPVLSITERQEGGFGSTGL
jgi:dUTP pyrophosphatase